MDSRKLVRDYHQRTKHHLERYAAGPQGLHWVSQPDPFRRFHGAKSVALPLLADRLTTEYRDLYESKHVLAQPLNRDSIAILLELSLGLSAWKQLGESRWALRCNPSSGNLHPTEGYVVCAGMEGLSGGVYHYQSFDHSLERRCSCKLPLTGGILLGLSSIYWREAWKYGERAFRYCQHDVGHALAAIRYAAAALGWRVQLLEHWSDAQITTVLGLDREGDYLQAEVEHADLALWVTSDSSQPMSPSVLIDVLTVGVWQGTANRLTAVPHREWPIIDEAAAASRKPETPCEIYSGTTWPPLADSPCELTAPAVIRQRRSMQACDGTTAMSSTAFYRLIDTLLPRTDATPWDVWPYPARIHVLMFVHRVTGLDPGLYVLVRDTSSKELLREALQRDEFDWQIPQGCPAHLPLFRLLSGDAREVAKTISCHQEIAADGAFSLGMLAAFDTAIAMGAWQYRRLFWEAGILGQVLYLEAEAAGIQGTGIGCYFDDAMHDLLGIQGTGWQSLYHFTVGKGVTDTRLQTQPPYEHRT